MSVSPDGHWPHGLPRVVMPHGAGRDRYHRTGSDCCRRSDWGHGCDGLSTVLGSRHICFDLAATSQHLEDWPDAAHTAQALWQPARHHVVRERLATACVQVPAITTCGGDSIAVILCGKLGLGDVLEDACLTTQLKNRATAAAPAVAAAGGAAGNPGFGSRLTKLRRA
jgi:hypothetical protein